MANPENHKGGYDKGKKNKDSMRKIKKRSL